MVDSKDKPEWWVENEDLREYLDLPSYSPPRFLDDVFTHEVVPDLEDRFGCTIRLMGKNTSYLEDWEVRLDGESLFTIGHRRDENGNTVYEIESTEFRRRIEAAADR